MEIRKIMEMQQRQREETYNRRRVEKRKKDK
jgi:hypothetical protein